MTVITNLSRRDVLKGTAATSGLVLGFHVGFRKLPFAEAAEIPAFQPNAFLSLDDTGLVTIVASRSGCTGIKNRLPLVLADELEADWGRVKIVRDRATKYGDQNTDGSQHRGNFGPMRVAGATARQMLKPPPQTWNVPVGECHAQNGFVVHAPSGRKLAYGDLASRGDDAGAGVEPGAAEGSEGLALYRQAARRGPQRHRPRPCDLWHRRRSGHEVCLGRALPGLWRGSNPSTPGRCRCQKCRAWGGGPGDPDAVGVQAIGRHRRRASNTWSAQRGRQHLKIGGLQGKCRHDSTAYRAELKRRPEPGKVVRNHGDVDGALASAAGRVSVDYFVPHLAHAQMEVPMPWHWAGNTCETWCRHRSDAGPPDRPRHQRGGRHRECDVAWRRLCTVEPDYVAEAALLSRMVGAPVR